MRRSRSRTPFRRRAVPHSAYCGNDLSGSQRCGEVSVGAVHESRAGGQLHHPIHYIGALDGIIRGVPSAVVGNAVVVQPEFKPGVAEERIHVPAGVELHAEFLVLFLADFQNAFQ